MRMTSFGFLPMRLRRPMILTAPLFLLVTQQDAAVAAGDDRFLDFDAYAAAALKDWNTPAMAVAAVKDGRVVFARGYGTRKLGGDAAVDTETVFPIASITKTFTATALAMLVDESKLHWTDAVTTHLPELRFRDAYLTRELNIADLLAHRTGLEDLDHSMGEFTRADLIRRAQFLHATGPFRVGNRYNNLGAILGGEIVGRVSGQSWADFVRRRIFAPLEMNATVPDVLELKDVKNVATSYVTVNDNNELREDPSWTLPLSDGWRRFRETIRPAGAICSTVNDMAKFLMFQLAKGEFRGRRLLKTETILEMQALQSVMPITEYPNPNVPYPKFLYGSGLGWQIRDYRGRKLVMHGGSTGTAIGFMAEENCGVVVLTNLGCGIQYMVLHNILDRLMGISRTWSNRDWINDVIVDYRKLIDAENSRLGEARRKDFKPPLALSQYAGTYISELYGQLFVKEANGVLHIQWGPNCHSELVHWSGDRFRATFVLRFPEDWFVSFVPQDGRIAKLAIERVYPSMEIASFARVADVQQKTKERP